MVVGSEEDRRQALACLKSLREGSRLQSGTLRTVIHILSRCYEDPLGAQILAQNATSTATGNDEGLQCSGQDGRLVQTSQNHLQNEMVEVHGVQDAETVLVDNDSVPRCAVRVNIGHDDKLVQTKENQLQNEMDEVLDKPTDQNAIVMRGSLVVGDDQEMQFSTMFLGEDSAPQCAIGVNNSQSDRLVKNSENHLQSEMVGVHDVQDKLENQKAEAAENSLVAGDDQEKQSCPMLLGNDDPQRDFGVHSQDDSLLQTSKSHLQNDMMEVRDVQDKQSNQNAVPLKVQLVAGDDQPMQFSTMLFANDAPQHDLVGNSQDGSLVQTSENHLQNETVKLHHVQDKLEHQKAAAVENSLVVGDDQEIQFSTDDIENMMMDIDCLEVPSFRDTTLTNQGPSFDLQNLLLGAEDVIQLDMNEDEVARTGNDNDICCPVQMDDKAPTQQLREADDSQISMRETKWNDDVEEGEIDDHNANGQSGQSQENDISKLHASKSGADQQSYNEQAKSSGKPYPCVDYPLANIDKVKDQKPSSDPRAEAVQDITAAAPSSTSAAGSSLASSAKDSFENPRGLRNQVFYGDLSEETSPIGQVMGSVNMDANCSKKRKRGGKSKESKKLQKNKKRAETDKKLGIKRMKLPPPLKPKVLKVCEHYLKGRCLKGEECNFSHDAIPLTKFKPCTHFARSNCMKGDNCPYDHQLSKYPCDNYTTTGSCPRGSSCLFSHKVPAKEESQVALVPDKPNSKLPGTCTKNLASSAAKIAVKPPSEVPKGLNFLSFGKPPSEDPPNKPKPIVEPITQSSRSAPSMRLSLSSKPVKSNGISYSAAPNSNNGSSTKADASKLMINSTSPLDQILSGLNSLVSYRGPLNQYSSFGLPGKQYTPTEGKKDFSFKDDNQKGWKSNSKPQVVDKMHLEATPAKVPAGASFSSLDKSSSDKQHTSVPSTKEGGKLVSVQDLASHNAHGNPLDLSAKALTTSASVPSESSQALDANNRIPSPAQISETKGLATGSAGYIPSTKKSKSSSASRSGLKSEPAKVQGVSFSSLDKSSSDKQLASEPSTKGSSKLASTNPPSQNAHNYLRDSSSKILIDSVSVPCASSQSLHSNNWMPSPAQKVLSSTSSKCESETKGPASGSAGYLQSTKESKSSSTSGSGFKREPVKASAVMDFIFRSGGKNAQK